HAAQDYLRKLISLGHRVAICEQVEDPAEAKKRGGKSPVKRDVVRLVTRGTITEDDLLPARGSNYIAALAMLGSGEHGLAVAWADVSTGETAVLDTGMDEAADEIARIDPAELLVDERTLASLRQRHVALPGEALQVIDSGFFNSETVVSQIRSSFAEAFDPTALSRTGRAALGALLAYVADSQKGAPLALRPPAIEIAAGLMAIDAATRS